MNTKLEALVSDVKGMFRPDLSERAYENRAVVDMGLMIVSEVAVALNILPQEAFFVCLAIFGSDFLKNIHFESNIKH